MRVKKIAAAVTAAGILMASSIYAANTTDSDIAQLQQQVKQLQDQINQLGKNQATDSDSTVASSKPANSNTAKTGSFIQTKPAWSQTMSNNQHLTNRDLDVLEARENDELTANTIYIGGKGEIDGVFTRATGGTSDTSSNQSQILMPFVDILFTAAIGDWITGFADLQVGDQFGQPISGQSSGSNAQNSNVTLPQAFFVVGNTDETPLFATLGVKVIDFGDFRQENTILPTLTQFAFMAQGGQVAAGYHNKEGLNAILTVMNGGGLALTNASTANGSAINNFAANISYDNKEFHGGVGYINGTGFTSGQGNYSVSDTTSTGRVGAVALNAGVDTEVFQINGDFIITTDKVNGLNSSSAFNTTASNVNGYFPLNNTLGNGVLPGGTTPVAATSFNGNTYVKSWDINGAFNLDVVEDHDLKIFGSYSQIMQDSDNSIYQFVLGARVNLIETVWVGPTYQYYGGKLTGLSVQSTNTLLIDITAYF